MSVSSEIREEQKKALSKMSGREKLAYFWDYYKLHVLAAVVIIAVAVSLIRQYINYKEYGFYAVLFNAGISEDTLGLSDTWQEEFQEYAQIDPEEYEVYIDTTMSAADSSNAQYALADRERLFAMMRAGDISAYISDTENFESYAGNGYFYDLRSILSADEAAGYEPYFYYTDAAAFDEEENSGAGTQWEDPALKTVNHRDPSSMEKPMAVGIFLTEDNKIADAGYYAYLEEGGVTYQGYPSEAVLGIPVTNQNPETAVQFLRYIGLGDS